MSNTYSLKVVRAESVIWEATLHRRIPDLFVKVTLDGAIRKSRTIKNNISPIWNETLTFPSSVESSTFKIELKHSSRLPVNPCVGSIDIKLADLLSKCANGEAAFSLLSPSGTAVVPVGMLILHLQSIDTATSTEINLTNARTDVEQRGIVSSATLSDSLAGVKSGTNEISTENGLYQVIGSLLSQLEVFKAFLDVVSKVHPFLTIAWQVTSVLYTSVANVFKTDKRVVELVRTMESAFAFVRDVQTLHNKVRSLQEPIIDLLKQTTECCLFVREYTRHGFVVRMLDLASSKKVDKFESSLTDLKRGVDSGIILHTAFVSSRVSETVDKLLLRQLLNPTLNDVFYRPDCLAGSRVEVQSRIMDWLVSETDQNILWLYGVAGSGKSTISTTIAKRLRELSRLGAFLFFERGKSEPSSIIRTIAYQLAVFDSSIASHILAYKKDITTADSSTQFDELLLQPLTAAAPSIAGPIFIVLDALDECGTPESRRSLMQLFRRDFPRLPNNFRIMITSRRETDIVNVLSSLPESVYSMELDYTSTTSRQDVLSYIHSEMRSAIEEQVKVPDDWPWDEHMALLGNTAGGLFIWASTAIKLVSNGDNPLYTLNRLVTDSTILTRFGLDDLYATVLRHSGIAWSDGRSKERFAKVMGLLLLSKTPMTSKTMDAILGFPPEEPSTLILSKLQCLLRFAPGEPVSLFHTSFSDYLLSAERSSESCFIDIAVQQHFIATRCFVVMGRMLRFNICDLETSFVRNDDVEGLEERVRMNIPPHLEYACLYWAKHLCGADYSPELLDRLAMFAYRRLLFWFEALSLLRNFGRVANFALRDAIAWLPAHHAHHANFSYFLKDASALATAFALSITQSTPHIYASMLPLTKDDSSVSAHYSSRTLSTVLVKRKGRKIPPRWTKVFEGHAEGVTSVAFSPDARYVVSGSWDLTIRLWDVNTGEAICRPFTGHLDVILSVSFSPDGVRIVSGSADRTVRVWSAQNGELVLGPLEGHNDAVRCVAFSPDGAKIVSSSDDRTIRVWDCEIGKLVLEPLVGHSDAVNSVAYSPDGELIVSGSKDMTVLVWDTKTGGIVTGPLVGHLGEVFSVCFSPDGKHVASGSRGAIKVWAVASGTVLSKINNGRDNTVYSIVFSRDGTRIASCSSDKTINVWDVVTTSLASGPFEGHTDHVNCVAFSPDDKSIVSSSQDNTIRLWDMDDRAIHSSPFVGHRSDIRSVAVSADGGRIVTGSVDRTIIVWNALDGTLILGPLEGHTGAVMSVVFSSDGALIASGSDDCTIRVWDAASGMVVRGPLKGHTDDVTSVAFSPDDALIASGCWDKTIRLWSTSKGGLVVEPLKGHTGSIYSISFSPDGALLASASDDKTIRIWNARRGTFISELKGHTDDIYCVAFSPNSELIASGSLDDTVIVWNVKSGQITAGPFEGHKGFVGATIFSSDSGHAISSGVDKTIRIWSVKSGQTVCKPLMGHTNVVISLAISPEGRRMFSASFDGTIRVWDIESILRPHHTEDYVETELPVTGSDTQPELADWMLGDNGWILGGQGGSELFLWVPPDLRPTLLSPHNTAIFGCQFSTELDFTDAALGEHWTECFTLLDYI